MLNSTFEFDNVRPAGGGVFALVVVLDGIGKDIGLAFTVGLGVLLGTDHDGLDAVAEVGGRLLGYHNDIVWLQR